MATQIDLGAVVSIGKGDWNEGTTYERANIVRHNSVAWICKVDSSIGVEPTETSSDWYLLVKDTSSVTSVNGQRGDINLDLITSEEVDSKISNLETTINSKLPNTMVGASDEISGKSGLVPTPAAGKQNKPLRGDGAWADFLDCVVSAIKDGETTIDAAKLKEMLANYLPLTGGKISGPIYQSIGALYTIITDAYKQVGLSCTEAGAGGYDGALLILNSGTSKYNTGGFNLRARTGVSGQDKELIGGKDGSLVWFNKHIVRSVNNVNADVNGNVSVTRTSRADAADILAGFDFFAGSKSHTLPGYGTWIVIIAPYIHSDTALMSGSVYTAKVAGGTQYRDCYLAAFRVG